MDDLVENYGIILIDGIVQEDKLKQKYSDVEIFSDGNFDFMLLGNCLGGTDELNYGVCMNMYKFFNENDQVK